MSAIASERKRLGYSQSDLAQEVGRDRSTIVRWEADTNCINSESLQKMADIFGCSVDYLLGRTKERLPNTK